MWNKKPPRKCSFSCSACKRSVRFCCFLLTRFWSRPCLGTEALPATSAKEKSPSDGNDGNRLFFPSLALPVKCRAGCQVWQKCRTAALQGWVLLLLGGAGAPREFPRYSAALELPIPGGNSQLEFPQQPPALGFTQRLCRGWAGHASPAAGAGTARVPTAHTATAASSRGTEAASLPLPQAFPSCVLWGHPSWPRNAPWPPRTPLPTLGTDGEIVARPHFTQGNIPKSCWRGGVLRVSLPGRGRMEIGNFCLFLS